MAHLDDAVDNIFAEETEMKKVTFGRLRGGELFVHHGIVCKKIGPVPALIPGEPDAQRNFLVLENVMMQGGCYLEDGCLVDQLNMTEEAFLSRLVSGAL